MPFSNNGRFRFNTFISKAPYQGSSEEIFSKNNIPHKEIEWRVIVMYGLFFFI